MTDISFIKNILYVNSKKIYEFELNIQKVITENELLFVLVEETSNAVYNRNLFCISKDGVLRWVGEDILEYLNSGPVSPPYAHYTNIWLDNHILWGNNYYGPHKVRIDMNTGKILECHYVM